MKSFFYVPAARRLLPVGKVTHNMSLGCRQIHFSQRVGHRLIRTPVQYPQQMSVMLLQFSRPLFQNVARYESF